MLMLIEVPFLHIDTDAIVINNIFLAVAMQVHTGAAGME